MKDNPINWRLLLICLFILGSIVLVISKIVLIQINDSNFLKEEGAKRNIQYKATNTVRGSIYDRNYFPLAITILNYDLYALKSGDLNDINKLIAEDILENIYNKNFNKKTLIKRNLSLIELKKIRELRLSSIEIEERQSRHYPLGKQISTLVGFAGKDNYGLEGLELSFNNTLAGKDGKQKFYRNAKQQIISQPIEVEESIKGRDLILTVDSNIQYYAYKYLAEAVLGSDAISGTAIVLDNKNGEVLAIASYPSFNPNDSSREIQKNRVFVDSYEPGSIIKPILLSGAIDRKYLDAKSFISTPQRISLDGNLISDTNNYKQQLPIEIISNSSQVGAAKIALMLGQENIITQYRMFGLAKPISVNFPSSSIGYINEREVLSNHEIASLGYGYGLQVSPFQMAVAYSAFANEGILKDFKLIKSDNYYKEERIISKDTANYILESLIKVVNDGTGQRAQVNGFSSGGKTGTAHKVKNGKYSKNAYTASFVGIAPIDTRALTIFVSIDEPGLNAYSGGDIAAPLFAKIAESSLNYLGYFQDE